MNLSKLSDSGGQRSLAGRSPWGHKESDTTPQLNNNTADLFCCTVEINTTIVKQLYSNKNQLQRIVNGQLFNQLVNHFFETSKKKKKKTPQKDRVQRASIFVKHMETWEHSESAGKPHRLSVPLALHISSSGGS